MHLLVNAVKVLRTAFNVVMCDSVLLELRPDLGNDLLHEVLTLRTVASDELYELVELFGMQILKTKVLELPLDPVDTESSRKRNVDIQSLLGLLYLLCGCLELQCPHVMKTVCELDEDDSDVVSHGKEHLADVLRLDVCL